MAMTEERPSGEVAGEAVGVGQREGAEGGFPALHGGAFDVRTRKSCERAWQIAGVDSSRADAGR
jgi:hypothetical protein